MSIVVLKCAVRKILSGKKLMLAVSSLPLALREKTVSPHPQMAVA